LRFIGLDVHRDFCEVAICLPGERARSAGRVATDPEKLKLFAESLDRGDRVVMESTGNALAIARVLEGNVAEVALANPMRVRAISHAKVKSDQFDARTLAELFQAGVLPTVWIGDERTRRLRRLTSRRSQLVRQRTRVKNEISAVLVRNLAGRPAASDLFGKRGRVWLLTLALVDDERQTVDACLRQIDFLSEEIAAVDRLLAESALDSPEIRRLMTIPGVDITTAATLMAAIGDIARFPSDRKLVGYLGLDARVRQSGLTPVRHGRISKQGSAPARHVLVEAAWAAIKTPGPLRAFYRRIKARRGPQIAVVAVARKLAVLSWQLLTKQEDYAFKRRSLVDQKLRKVELRAGAPKRSTGRRSDSPARDCAQQERALVEQAEQAYLRLVTDWKASRPAKDGAGAAPGRASQGPSSDQAARQAPAPTPALSLAVHPHHPEESHLDGSRSNGS
jgi:transposase